MIDTKTAVKMLHEIQRLNPEYTPSKNPSTFLIVELVENDEEIMELTTSVIDPGLSDRGDAKAYLALPAQQRAILELSNLINAVTSGIAAVAKQAPLSKDLWDHAEHDLNRMCSYLQQLSVKAAVACLTQNKPEFDVRLKAGFTVSVGEEE